MIAIDITQFLRSLPPVRGPAVFLNALILASLDRDVHFAFNPHYVGSQLYFQVVAAKDFRSFLAHQATLNTYRPLSKSVVKRFLRLVRIVLLELFPGLVARFPMLHRGGGHSPTIYPSVAVAHHSSFKQMVSFLASDSLWGLPMPGTKKTLFLYDITFFEILRMISSPVICESSPFIVGHVIKVNQALRESHSIIVPTRYLVEQLPLHFPTVHGKPIDVVPLASTLVDVAEYEKNRLLRFKPQRRSSRKNSVLVVCGFDGFKNDNKGMGAILDIVCLQKKLFATEKPVQFTLVTPQLDELMQRIEELDIGDCVTVLSGLPVPSLIEEYHQARFLWVHSIDEGFCLPVLEAAMLGVPTLISDVPSLREIWGDTVDYIDPFNRYEAVAKLHTYCTGNRLATDGANTLHAQNYTIEKTADGVWSALKKVA